MLTTRLARPLAVVRALRGNRRGMALIEFALASPIFLAMGFSALEVGNLSLSAVRISQIGMTVADNTARAGVVTGTAPQQIFEADIEDIFRGAEIQGAPMNFRQRGRMIISSLQRNAGGGQWIAWQRCFGNKAVSSSFGLAGAGRTNNSFLGMGPAGNQITAPAGGAVIFVEIVYDYQPIVETVVGGLQYLGLNFNNQPLRYNQAYIVRNPRQLGNSATATPSNAEDYGLFQNSPAIARRTLPGSGAHPDYSNMC
ncbi:MAG: TadE/TadG family type IV pilus assembly protein [Sphingomonadaceae bacterium]